MRREVPLFFMVSHQVFMECPGSNCLFHIFFLNFETFVAYKRRACPYEVLSNGDDIPWSFRLARALGLTFDLRPSFSVRSKGPLLK